MSYSWTFLVASSCVCTSPDLRIVLASPLLRGHLALATLSLPETDPQILELWGWWSSPGQINPSEGFLSRMSAWRTTVFVNFTHRIGFLMSELFRKIDEDFGPRIQENATQLSCIWWVNILHKSYIFLWWCSFFFFNMATAVLSSFFQTYLLGCSSTWRCAYEHFSKSATLSGPCKRSILEDAAFHRMNWCTFLWGNPCRVIKTFYHLYSCLWDFGFSTHFCHSAAWKNLEKDSAVSILHACRTLPVGFPLSTISQGFRFTLLCPLILDHGVPFIISIFGLKILDS